DGVTRRNRQLRAKGESRRWFNTAGRSNVDGERRANGCGVHDYAGNGCRRNWFGKHRTGGPSAEPDGVTWSQRTTRIQAVAHDGGDVTAALRRKDSASGGQAQTRRDIAAVRGGGNPLDGTGRL